MESQRKEPEASGTIQSGTTFPKQVIHSQKDLNSYYSNQCFLGQEMLSRKADLVHNADGCISMFISRSDPKDL
jgi:hypothetical protein